MVSPLFALSLMNYDATTFSYFSFVLASVVRERVNWAWMRAPSCRNCKALHHLSVWWWQQKMIRHEDAIPWTVQELQGIAIAVTTIITKHNPCRNPLNLVVLIRVLPKQTWELYWTSEEWGAEEGNGQYELYFNWDQIKSEAATADLWWRMQRGTRRDGGRRIRQGERLPVKARVTFSLLPAPVCACVLH